tara:strand:+ start:5330 stop:5848 length:519 start_codon:yes stop_codon:yes gene_type:complete
MYAIIRTGGKQYKVSPGDSIRVEKLDQELGSEFDIEEVLFVGGEKAHLGQPTVSGASVRVVVTDQNKDKKILVLKKKRRKGYRKQQGHRQLYTELFVAEIKGPDGSAKADKKAKVIDRSQKKEKKAEEKTAKKKVAKKKTAAKKKSTAKKKTKQKTTTKKKAAKKKTTKKKA